MSENRICDALSAIFTAWQGKPLPTPGNLIIWWRNR